MLSKSGLTGFHCTSRQPYCVVSYREWPSLSSLKKIPGCLTDRSISKRIYWIVFVKTLSHKTSNSQLLPPLQRKESIPCPQNTTLCEHDRRNKAPTVKGCPSPNWPTSINVHYCEIKQFFFSSKWRHHDRPTAAVSSINVAFTAWTRINPNFTALESNLSLHRDVMNQGSR